MQRVKIFVHEGYEDHEGQGPHIFVSLRVLRGLWLPGCGLLREKTGDVVACTIVHGGLDAVGEGLAIVMGLTL